MGPVIEINSLKKSYGSLSVLKGIDFTLEQASISALLGPNGSGKSTLIKCILGLVLPDSGEIRINSTAIAKGWQYRENIGYMPQIAHFPENILVEELISMMKDIRRCNAKDQELIEIFNLKQSLRKPVKTLSGGTRQRLSATITFMYDAPILIFDEATVGLDPVSRITFKDYLLQERAAGKTILLVSHFINEVEELADDLIFLLDGKVYFKGTPSEMQHINHEKNLDKLIANIIRQADESLVS